MSNNYTHEIELMRERSRIKNAAKIDQNKLAKDLSAVFGQTVKEAAANINNAFRNIDIAPILFAIKQQGEIDKISTMSVKEQ